MPGEDVEAADAFVHQVARDWREAAELSAAERALCEFAERLSQDTERDGGR